MISRLHYITQDLPDISHAELVEFACKGGADWVQLRIKKQPIPNPSQREGEKEILEIASEVKEVCIKYGAKLIVNDYIFIAKKIKADGVHLGKEDMNVVEARKILGRKFIIGGTANTLNDVQKLVEAKADYIGVGPFHFTMSKDKLSPVLGIDGIWSIMKTKWFLSLPPIIVIGGICLEDVDGLMQTGVHGIAVSSAINLAKDKIEITKRFCHELHEFENKKSV